MQRLERYGGMLLHPRRTLAASSGDRFDAWVLGAAYVAGCKSAGLIEALADLLGMGNTSGWLMLLSALARAIVPVMLALVVCEVIVGTRPPRREHVFCLVPFVVVGIAWHLSGVHGPAFAGEVLATLVAAAWAWWVRATVRSQPSESRAAEAPGPDPRARETPAVPDPQAQNSRAHDLRAGAPWASRSAGLAVLLLAATSGGRDIASSVERWDMLGPLPAGETLPTFALPYVGDADTRVFESTRLRGKATVVAFWATWCTACRAELPMLEALHREADSDTQILLVNREGGGLSLEEATAIVTRFRRDGGYSLPSVVDDGRLGRALRVKVLPHIVVVDGEGVIRFVHQGIVSGSTLASELRAVR